MLGALVLLVFYLAAWWQHGRDPKRGTIIPLFSAPAGLVAGSGALHPQDGL